MRRSSSIRCLSEVIGETSSDDKIRNRARKEGPRARRTGASQLPRSGLVQLGISEAGYLSGEFCRMFSELEDCIHRQLELALAGSIVVRGAIESMIKSDFGTQSRSEEHTSELQSLRHLVC